MDIKNYIASGMIEGYLYGLATPEERAEFERRLKIEPELQKEYEIAQQSLLQHNQLFDKEIPSSLDDQIWEKLSKTNQQVEPEKNKIITSAENIVAKQAPLIVRLMPFVVAASLALFSISSYLAWSYSKQLQSAEERIAAIEKENLNSQVESKIQKEEYDKAVKLLNVFNQNGINMVKLVGKEISPDSKIMVCWNKSTQEVMLHDMSMPDPPKGKAYQLWAIVDGKPVDLGMVSLDAKKEMITMKKGVSKPSAFAITLEDEGGVESPTMEQLYVIGNI